MSIVPRSRCVTFDESLDLNIDGRAVVEHVCGINQRVGMSFFGSFVGCHFGLGNFVGLTDPNF